MFNIHKIKLVLAWLSFFFAMGFGITGMILPPPGEIDSSVLIFVAQLLVFVCTLLGLQMKANPISGDISNIKKSEEESC